MPPFLSKVRSMGQLKSPPRITVRCVYKSCSASRSLTNRQILLKANSFYIFIRTIKVYQKVIFILIFALTLFTSLLKQIVRANTPDVVDNEFIFSVFNRVYHM